MSENAGSLEQLERELRELRRLVGQLGSAVIPVAVSFKQAAQMLSCSQDHVTRLVKRGVLIPRDVGGLRRIPVSEIYALLETPTPMASSGASKERTKFDAAAALKKLDELTQKKRR